MNDITICDFCGVADDYRALPAAIPEICRAVPIWVDWSGFDATHITRTVAQRAFVRAFAEWHHYLDVRCYLTAAESQATCKVVWVDSEQLGLNVLATSNLADGTCLPDKSQAYARTAHWTADLLYLVVLHEVGHLLGLRHLTDGRAIMNAGIRTEMTGLTALDVQAALDLGYELRTPLELDEESPPTDREIADWWRAGVELLKRSRLGAGY